MTLGPYCIFWAARGLAHLTLSLMVFISITWLGCCRPSFSTVKFLFFLFV